MEYEVKVIPEQKLGVINCKTPISDLGVFLSMPLQGFGQSTWQTREISRQSFLIA